MTLTTKNQVWIFAVGSTVFDRYLTNQERFMLQGWGPTATTLIPEDWQAHAAGNAMAIPAVALVFRCTYADKRLD